MTETDTPTAVPMDEFSAVQTDVLTAEEKKQTCKTRQDKGKEFANKHASPAQQGITAKGKITV